MRQLGAAIASEGPDRVLECARPWELELIGGDLLVTRQQQERGQGGALGDLAGPDDLGDRLGLRGLVASRRRECRVGRA